MEPLLTALQGVLPPVVAALLLVSLASARALGLAAALGALGAYALLKRWPSWPHQLWAEPDGTQWLLWSVLGAAVLGLAEPQLPPRLRAPAAGLAAAGAVGLVLQKVMASWTPAVAAGELAAAVAVLVLLVLGQRSLFARQHGLPLPALLLATFAVDAGLLVAGHSALLGQLAGAFAAALGAGIATRWWRRPSEPASADAAWLSIAHGGLLLAGVHLAYVDRLPALLAAAVPLVPWLLRSSLTGRRGWLLAALALLPGLLGLGLQVGSRLASPY